MFCKHIKKHSKTVINHLKIQNINTGRRHIRYILCVTACILILFPLNSAFSDHSLGSIRVIVKDFYSNDPISNASIFIATGKLTGTTSSSGEAVLDDITPYRNYQVDVEADGYIKQSAGFVTVNPDEETLTTVPLNKKATVTGTVEAKILFDWLRLPVRNAVVILGKTDTNYFGEEFFLTSQSVRTDSAGRYSFDYVDEDSYILIALPEGYKRSERVILDVESGQEITQNLNVEWVPGRSNTPPPLEINDLSGVPLELPTLNGIRVVIDTKQNTDAVEFYWIKEVQPEGAEPVGKEYYMGTPPGQNYTFILPAMGDYTVRSITVDAQGLVSTNTAEFTAANVAPVAVPSVIPGPSELPYYNKQIVYSKSQGVNSVKTGTTIYLRGFAVDANLLSPEEFNPDAPGFDIYGTKNGNFSASVFKYSWSLTDSSGNDISSILKPSDSPGNVNFDIPGDASPGDSFTATLTVTGDDGKSSEPEDVLITVAERVDDEACSECHASLSLSYSNTRHAMVDGGAGCQDCHGSGSEHIAGKGSPRLSVSYWPGVCGQCHKQFAELQKSNHSDPVPFGYYEPTEGRLTTCYKCHYTPGFVGAVKSGEPFSEFKYGSETLPAIAMDTPNVSCSVCHDPHSAENPQGLRTGSAGTTCETCHNEKWQNTIIEGLSGEFENGYHYPGEDYSFFLADGNPHHTEKKCVLCHMSRSDDALDYNGIRKIGGHTFRMRDFGPDNIPETSDDILIIKVCQHCHEGLETFDLNGFQTEIKGLMDTLFSLLSGSNHEFLPANQPGKCARCHKGGTVPFLDDPDGILENAYTNYKLFVNDRSRGMHNPGYIKKLLQDSIDDIRNNYKPSEKE